MALLIILIIQIEEADSDADVRTGWVLDNFPKNFFHMDVLQQAGIFPDMLFCLRDSDENQGTIFLFIIYLCMELIILIIFKFCHCSCIISLWCFNSFKEAVWEKQGECWQSSNQEVTGWTIWKREKCLVSAGAIMLWHFSVYSKIIC